MNVCFLLRLTNVSLTNYLHVMLWQMEVYTEYNWLYSRDYRQHMSHISLLSSDTNFVSVASSWFNLRGQHQVSYMAWTYNHVPFYSSRPVLYRLLGSHKSFSIQGKY